MTKREMIAKFGDEDFGLLERVFAARKKAEFGAGENKKLDRMAKLVRKVNAAKDRK
jgi:hypothetical protein